MTHAEARRVWQYLDLGVNFMTPEALDYGFIGDTWVYEFSKGTGIYHEPIYGISVRERGTGRRIAAYSQLCTNKQQVNAVIDQAERNYPEEGDEE